MKIKLKNEIFANRMTEALGRLTQKPLDAREAFHLNAFVKQVNEKQVIFNTTRSQIIGRYVKKDKAGKWEMDKAGSPAFPSGKLEKVTDEMKKLVDIEQEYELKMKIKYPKDEKISSMDAGLLSDILDLSI